MGRVSYFSFEKQPPLIFTIVVDVDLTVVFVLDVGITFYLNALKKQGEG